MNLQISCSLNYLIQIISVLRRWILENVQLESNLITLNLFKRNLEKHYYFKKHSHNLD